MMVCPSLRRGRDYPAPLGDPNGGGQIKWMPVRYALSHFCFCAYAGASSATLRNKNAPPERRGHPFDLRRGRDYRHTPCDTVIPRWGASIPNRCPFAPLTSILFCASGPSQLVPSAPNKMPRLLAGTSVRNCGEGGIRTRDTLSSIHTFQACSFNHSDTSPEGLQMYSLQP